MKKVIITILALCLLAVPAMGAEFGVYVKSMGLVEGTFDSAVQAAEDGLKAAGFDVLASFESGVESECAQRAHTIVFMPEGYADEIMAHGPTAAFALPLRASIYEDESGINVDFTNPSSINRTVLGDDKLTELSATTATSIHEALTKALKGEAINSQIGQIRKKGHVGGMGGGKFLDKVDTIYEGGSYADVTEKVNAAIAADTTGWNLIYSIEPAKGITVFGLSKESTEARCYNIAGQKRQKKTYKCPGLDHAPSFPIEVVVYDDNGSAKVITLDEMYRMKVYFEDAGNWAFMKNMSMPGQIQDEIEDVVTAGLVEKKGKK